MKPDLTTLEGNLAACDHGDTERKRLMEDGEDNTLHLLLTGRITRNYAPFEPPTQTEIHCREHRRERFEKMLERVYGFFRRKS